MLQILLEATIDTLRMVFIASVFTILIGMPLGLLLEATQNKHILGNKYLWLHKLLRSTINFFSNIPIFLMLIMLIPIINKVLFEHFTIELSAVIALIFIGIFIFANDVFNSLNNLPKELSDTAKFLGARSIQVITKFLLPEAMHHLVQNITKLIINLIGLSMVASALGSNGLGRLALEKGYNDLELSYVFYIILLSTSIIYAIKLLGNYVTNTVSNATTNKNQEHAQ